MNRTLIGALSALALSAGAIGVGATTATAADANSRAIAAQSVNTTVAAKPKAVTFEGAVALSNCSGSVVKLPNSTDQDRALVMSNGHCLDEGFPAPGKVVVNKPSSRSFTLLNATAGNAGKIKATKIAYATMTDTDVSLYETDTTYAGIKQKFGVKALELSGEHPKAGAAISVVSGYWKKQYTCNIDGFVHQLREGKWTWKDSVRYTPQCQTIGGTSGSPVVDTATGKVIAVNNTGNESGERCTDNNPCEVDQNGKITVRKGINYAQQSYQITQCVAKGNKVDLSLPGCTLPKP
ncbi:S1 family peptidase [Streptomyces zagrosensis]|uniref:V8-like Glu-specific endopeptidase n=1 Tax=Streptomyces zagrosensis TaxID=1042984 RepID=A0A7W9QEG8_9ACTN|nr:serine protease [Streptomyces zagrosensis]MBB5938218.1 V8-like Glu-specific endopeptidase [Streptomyces zagrosensis]